MVGVRAAADAAVVPSVTAERLDRATVVASLVHQVAGLAAT